jgi:hypothetical protein
MKHKFLLFLVTLIIFLNEFSIKCYEENSNPLIRNFLKLPDKNVYWQGWVKYFHYNNVTSLHKPRSFYQNNDFYRQRIPYNKKNNRDNFGLLRIPSKQHFFLVLYKDSLIFYTARDRIRHKIYDSLKIDHINLVPEDQPLKGGVKDLGNFDEGKCFEIKATIPKVYRNNFNPMNNKSGIFQTWILCTDNDRAKNTLLSNLLKKKLKTQREHNVVVTIQFLKNLKKRGTTNFNFGKKRISRGKSVDGYWILLQDWTSCTLRCGGGKSYQHWMCVPPKNKGKPCRGQAVKVRECNNQKCPPIGNFIKNRLIRLRKAQQKASKPMIVTVGRLTNKPQRYSKCNLKENDAFLSKYNIHTKLESKQPVRLVMNNQTVSLFADENYLNKLYSFNFDKTSIHRSGFCCIGFRDNYKSLKLCGFPGDCGTRINNRWSEQWISDFRLFKEVCSTNRQISHANGLNNEKKNFGEMFDEELEKTTQYLSSPNNEIQRQAAKFQRNFQNKLQNKMIEMKEKKIMKSVRKNEKKKGRMKLLATQNSGINALVKENELENLVSKEEKERESKLMEKLVKRIRNEKKKKKCLKKKIKKRRLDIQIQMEKRDAEKEVKEAKEEVKMEIAWKRKMMKRQIAQLRMKARRKRAALQSRLQRIRIQMAKNIMEANRQGDMMLCKKGKYNASDRNNYCDVNYIEDFVRNSECKDEKEFCYMCCEHEFGSNFLDERTECYDMCDGNSSGKPKKKSKISIAAQMKKAAAVSNSGTPKDNKPLLGGWVWRKFSRKKKNQIKY